MLLTVVHGVHTDGVRGSRKVFSFSPIFIGFISFALSFFSLPRGGPYARDSSKSPRRAEEGSPGMTPRRMTSRIKEWDQWGQILPKKPIDFGKL
jgi:hypothetical protein